MKRDDTKHIRASINYANAMGWAHIARTKAVLPTQDDNVMTCVKISAVKNIFWGIC